MIFTLKSNGIIKGMIDRRYGKFSEDVINGIPQISIPLEWSGCPEGTKSLALIFIDNDNYQDQGVSWLHWSVANIPSDVTCLAEDCSRRIKDTDSRIVQGKNSWILERPEDSPECNRYGGPAPTGFDHEYTFVLYALDGYVDLEDGYYQNQLQKKIRDRILGRACMTGRYSAGKE